MKAESATLCPQCLAANIVATKGGPTCRHQLNSGALWFAHQWEAMGETDRIAWLKRNSNRNGVSEPSR